MQSGLDPNGHKEGMTGPVGYWQVVSLIRIRLHTQKLAGERLCLSYVFDGINEYSDTFDHEEREHIASVMNRWPKA